MSTIIEKLKNKNKEKLYSLCRLGVELPMSLLWGGKEFVLVSLSRDRGGTGCRGWLQGTRRKDIQMAIRYIKKMSLCQLRREPEVLAWTQGLCSPVFSRYRNFQD